MRLVILVILGGPVRLVCPGSLVILGLTTSRCCHSTHPSQPNLSMVRGGVILTLTSNKATQSRQSKNSRQSNAPSHTSRTSQSRKTCTACQNGRSIQPFQPVAPSRPCRTYLYSRSSRCGRSIFPIHTTRTSQLDAFTAGVV